MQIEREKMEIWILIISALVMCGISFYLWIRDTDKINRPMLVYTILSVLIVIGISYALCVIYEDNTFIFNLKRIGLLSILWPVAYIDFCEYKIPNKFIILGLIYRVFILFIELIVNAEVVLVTVISEVIAAVALLIATILCRICIKNSIGFGDIKLFIVIGLLLGLEGIWGAVFMTLIVSFFVALFLLISKKKKRTDSIPFGPAVAVGTFLSVFLTGM